MSTALAEAVPITTSFAQLSVDDITESPGNPRKRFNELEELAQSVREQGVIEPLIVRPHPGRMDGYELVAGARRLRAAKLAGLADVPCLIRTLTDLQVLEIQVTENLQRKDVHPLEEADAYAALMKADRAYTVEAVAARVGRSSSYVYQRLKLKDLTEDSREAFEAEEITAAHAVRLARLSEADQAKAFDECFYELFGSRSGQREVRPVAHLDEWIADHTKVDVTDRASVQHYLPDLHQQLADEPEPEKLLALSTSLMPAHYLGTKDHGVLGHGRWKAVKSEKACPHTQRGVVVHGSKHQVLWVCAKKGCPKHWPVEKKAPAETGSHTASKAPAYDWKAEQAKREQEEKRCEQLRPFVLAEVAKKYAYQPLTDDLVRGALEAISPDDHGDLEAAILASGKRVSALDAGAVFSFVLALESNPIWLLRDLQSLCKKHKVDLKAIEKEVDAEAKAETTSKKTANKKGGKR